MLRNWRILILSLFLPLLSNCQTSKFYHDYVNTFSKCNKLNIDGLSYKENAIVYLELQKINDRIELIRLVGVHKKEVYQIILNTINCMDADKIGIGSFNCIYIIDGMFSTFEKSTQVRKERREKISGFKAKYNLPDDIEVIETYYGNVHR